MAGVVAVAHNYGCAADNHFVVVLTIYAVSLFGAVSDDLYPAVLDNHLPAPLDLKASSARSSNGLAPDNEVEDIVVNYRPIQWCRRRRGGV